MVLQPPEIDPLDVVHPVGEKKDDGQSNTPSEPTSLPEKIIGLFWKIMPAIMAVLVTLYLLQGYVKVTNYAADSKGLNGRVTLVENTTVSNFAFNKALSPILTQINGINAGLSSVNSSYIAADKSTADKLAVINSSLTQIQSQLTALQVSAANISGLQKTLDKIQIQILTLQAQVANITAIK